MKKYLSIFFVMCGLFSSGYMFQKLVHSAVLSVPKKISKKLINDDNCVLISETNSNVLSASIFESYYLSPEEPVFSYLQNNSIKRFFNMWAEYFIDKDIKIHWNYDTIAPVQVLDHNFNSIVKPDTELYTCTFSTDDDRCGYIIVSYNENGPSVTKWSLNETTPYLYDLKANSEQIADALMKTDIDLSTATAVRVEWIDTDKNRGDRIILFKDGKGDKYICYLGDADYSFEKQ